MERESDRQYRDDADSANHYQRRNNEPYSDIFQSEKSLPEGMHYSRSLSEVSRQMQQPRIQKQQESQSGQYYCMKCKKSYNIKIQPCKHKKKQKNRFKCNYQACQRSFPISSSLQRHKLIHQGKKPYTCDYQSCDQRFNQKSNLNRHKRVHTQEKPFICQTCCKAFTTTTNLKQHVQIHLEDKNRRKKYICQVRGCNKEYFYMCNLKKHKQEHQDPLCDCIVQKKPDLPFFGVNIGTCLFRIAFKNISDCSQLTITHDQKVKNGIIYNLQLFQKALRKQEDDGNEAGSCMQQLDEIVRKIFEQTKNAMNIRFEVHQQMRQISNELIKTLMILIGQTNIKIFTLIIPQYTMFTQMVSNLLTQLQPQE